MNKYRLKLSFILIALLCFSLMPAQASLANTTKDLTKIGATANIQDDWILIDTDMSDDEIKNILGITDEVMASVRAQWNSAQNVKIEYDICMAQHGLDILISTGGDEVSKQWQEGNNLDDAEKTEFLQELKSGFGNLGAINCTVERADRAGQFAWRTLMTVSGKDIYEYQILHGGKYITFAINKPTGTLTQEYKNFLDNFMNSLTIKNSSTSNSSASSANTTPNGRSTHERTPLWTRVLTRAAIGAAIGAICGIVGVIIRLVQKKKK